MPIVPCFDPSTGASGGPSGGGGATTYDVSPPAATTEATAAGVALSAKTFGSFTGTDAGLIDGYTARTVNAAGSTSWSGSGLGAYTPSGGADGDAGVLALDATIGGVVVATALHDYSRAASSGSVWTDILDWSSASESFSAGEGTYTIGGLSVTLDYDGSAGPTSIALTSGVLTVEADDTDYAYLIIDLGEDFYGVPLWAAITTTGVAGLGSITAVQWQMADDTTIGNDAGHWQELIGQGGTATALLGRWASGPLTFTAVNSRTVTDVTTTPTRVVARIDGNDVIPSYDQGSASLPSPGDDAGTLGPAAHSGSAGAYTIASAGRNLRYMHIAVRCDATIRVAAAKLET